MSSPLSSEVITGGRPADGFRRGVLLIVLSSIGWGTGGIVAARLFQTSSLNAVDLSFWRFVGGAAVLAILRLFLGGGSLRERLRRDWRRVILTGVGIVFYQWTFFAAIPHIGVAITTVIALGGVPPMVAAASWLVARQRLTRRGVVAMALSVVGLVLLVFNGDTAAPGGNVALGVLFALLSAAGYAAVTLGISLAERDGPPAERDPISNVLLSFIVGALVLAPIAAARGFSFSSTNVTESVLWLLYLGLIPSAVAYWFFFVGLETVPATIASIVTLVEPVSASVLAVLILGERLSLVAWFGMIVILGSVLLLTLEHPPPAPD